VKRRQSVFMTVVVIAIALGTTSAGTQTERWPEQKANAWYAQQPWLVGSNYIPKSAINQLEMWQEETFDPIEIDKELTWAEAMGMNTMRVFLHDLLWKQDAAGSAALRGEFALAGSLWPLGAGSARALTSFILHESPNEKAQAHGLCLNSYLILLV
jgi:hypothetical protein